MKYIEFINYVVTWLSGTTVSGSTYLSYVEKVLEDEIELNTLTRWPAAFVCPIPITYTDHMMVQYGCRIFIATGPITKENRFTHFSDTMTFVSAFLQQIPDEFINYYPFDVNPILLWDANVDGIVFELKLTNSVICY